MADSRLLQRGAGVTGIGLLLALGLLVASGAGADAATVINGPVDLGTASTYGVLGASTVTNTGPTVVNGDIGVSPGSSITGFSVGNGTFTGAENDNNTAAADAQGDLTTAFNDAASLTPTTSGLTELNGLSLTPGVYSGGALSLAGGGALTLAGSATSVWVFQAASSLTIGSGSQIIITGGATSCNVFWEVGSSATLGTTAQFQGTILAKQSITADTGATIQGRLLANTAAVTLDSNTITVPGTCGATGTPVSSASPAITSGTPTAATAGTPYSFTVTSTGTPAPTYTVTSGALPAGLTLNGTTGVISGTPTTPGSSTFTVTASNGVAPSVSAIYTVNTAAAAVVAAPVGSTALPAASSTTSLADTGSNIVLPMMGGLGLLLAGLVLLALRRTVFSVRSR